MPSKNSSQASRGRDVDGGATDGRKGRSRSPSGYIRKSGKSMKGFLGGSKKKKKKSSKQVKASGDYSSNSGRSAGEATSNAYQPPQSSLRSATTPAGGDAKPSSSSKSDASSSFPPAGGTSSFEEETVYDVVVDDSSTLPGGGSSGRANGGSAPSSPARPAGPSRIEEESSPTSAAPQASPFGGGAGAPTIQLILLLMELTSRRFELLQLEFDPHKALSSDILSQVPVAATEESLRVQKYSGICNVRGKEMRGDTQLLDFVEGVDEDGGAGGGKGRGGGGIAIAIPEGISGKECAKLAAPILNDPKVKMMLDQTLEAVAQHAASIRRQQEMESRLRKQAEKNNDSAANATSRAPPRAVASSARGGSARDFGGVTASTDGSAPVGTAARKGGGGDGPSALRMMWMAVVVAALVPILVTVQKQLTAPLSPWDEFAPGVVGGLKSRCGFLTFLPRGLTDCHDQWVMLSGDGSVLTCYDVGNVWTAPFRKTVAWRLSSPPASNGQQPSPALKVLGKGKVTMSGKKKTTLEYYTTKGSSSQAPVLTPWPFEVDPKVSNRKRVKRG